MVLQPVSQTKSRFVQLATSGLLLIQATIATTAISAFTSTQPGWFARAIAQEQLTFPSTSATDLGKPLESNCQPTKVNEDKPSFCGGVGEGVSVPPTKTIQVKLSPICTYPDGSLVGVCISLP